jgi:heme-degrading monooxygenase HmoA
MIMTIAKFEVEDFNKWKEGFTVAEGLRKSAGAKGGQVFQGDGNPKLVAVIIEWDNLENAKKYFQNPALKEIQQKAGVKGVPDVAVLQAL